MTICGAPHPDQPGVRCEADREPGTHSDHYAAPAWVWPCPDYAAARERQRPLTPRELLEIARGIRADIAAADRPPVVRNDDPWTAHRAAEQIEPTRGSKEAQVLAYLRERANTWVNGLEFRTAEVGGASGDRRCRALAEEYGFDIRRRPPATGRGVWDYMLVEDPG